MNLIFVTGPACQPCEQMKPVIEQLESEGNVTIERLNVVDDLDKIAELGVRSTPTLVLDSNYLVGYNDLSTVKGWIEGSSN